jgi:hypothetical protein
MLVKFPRLLSLLLLSFTLLPAYAGLSEYMTMLSPESRGCYHEALGDSTKGRPQAALAKLEALLLTTPVSVGIDEATIPGRSTEFYDGVQQGIRIWADSLPDSPFRFAEAGEKPTVLIKFVPHIAANRDLQGQIEAQHQFQWTSRSRSTKLTALMQVVYKTEGRLLRREEVAQVVAHELGHLLGLTDEDRSSGLMGPFTPGRLVRGPSKTEIAAVNEFRKAIRENIQRIQAKL